jgi:hypothetical protein
VIVGCNAVEYRAKLASQKVCESSKVRGQTMALRAAH